MQTIMDCLNPLTARVGHMLNQYRVLWDDQCDSQTIRPDGRRVEVRHRLAEGLARSQAEWP